MLLVAAEVRVSSWCAAGRHQDVGSHFGRQRAVPDAHGDLVNGLVVRGGTGRRRARLRHLRRGAGGEPLGGGFHGLRLLHAGGGHGARQLQSGRVVGAGDGRRLPSGRRGYELASDRFQHAGHTVRLVVRQPDDGEHGPGHQTAAANERRRSPRLALQLLLLLLLRPTAVAVQRRAGAGGGQRAGRRSRPRRPVTGVRAVAVAVAVADADADGRARDNWAHTSEAVQLEPTVTAAAGVRRFPDDGDNI